MKKKDYTYEELQEFRGDETKAVNLLILYDFYNNKTGLEWSDCFCTRSARLTFNRFFFQWLDEYIKK